MPPSEELLSAAVAAVDEAWTAVRAQHADPMMLSEHCKEHQEAWRRLTGAIADCWKIKQALARGEELWRNHQS